MKVMVYYNLHKKLFSIKCLKRNKVIYHTKNVVLKNCKLKVSEKGRQRVLNEKRKNVHAGIVGDLISLDSQHCKFDFSRELSYNPYKNLTFVKKADGSPVYDADTIVLDTYFGPKIYYW